MKIMTISVEYLYRRIAFLYNPPKAMDEEQREIVA